jgi:MoxR-like ATPase
METTVELNTDAAQLQQRIERFQTVRDGILTQVRQVIVGQDEVLDQILIALFVGGHCLITGMPGTAKTLMVRTIAETLGLTFRRIQFTPDLMPSDITGTDIIEEDVTTGRRTWTFVEGPIFGNVVLADEINRTPPKTQAAMLEAMQERSCTVRGHVYKLPSPFFVLATQNPIELEGTYPLPEAQLDRFLVRIAIGYPAEEAELAMLYARQHNDPLELLEAIASAEDLAAIQHAVRGVEVKPAVGRYLLSISAATRQHGDVALGASPRGTLSLFRASQARAYMNGRGYVSPDDVQALCLPVLGHRIALTPEARYGGRGVAGVLSDVVGSVRVPL